MSTASIVVPTYNRAARLPRLLESLESQDASVLHEVIFVDDCSPDETWSVLQSLARQASIPVRTLRTPRNSGPATARNLGWRAATAPLVVFTDDDCLPQPGWLKALVSAAQDTDVVQGCTDANPYDIDGPFARKLVVLEWSDLFETCNVVFHRALLERLGGFDESFPRPYGEDTDLGWRALECGASTGFEPSALVYHDIEHTTHLRDFVAQLRGHTRKMWMVRTLKLHPGLRRRVHRRWFYEPHHPRTLLGLVATAVAVGRRGRGARAVVLGAGWLPYLHHRVVSRPRRSSARKRVPVLVLGLVSDVTEVAVLAVGSVRFRKLLL